VVLTLALVALLALAWKWRPSAPAGTTGAVPEVPATSGVTLAVIGNVPYSTFQLRTFPKLVDQIGSNPDSAFVAHLGNLKNDESPCSDAYYSEVRGLLDTFPDPLLYTPGQNDWANCHKRQNGGTSPLNRLGGLRNFFFASPNTGLAQRSERFRDYAADRFPENVRFAVAGTSFAAIHVVGSENGLRPWTGASTVNREQRDEVTERTRSAIRVLQDTFAGASAHGDRSVVIFTHADMFPPGQQSGDALVSAYKPIVSALAAEAAAFPGEVYLLDAGSGVYRSDRPLAGSSSWRKLYDVTERVDRLHRVTVDGAAQAGSYLRMTIDYESAKPVTWVRVPVSS